LHILCSEGSEAITINGRRFADGFSLKAFPSGSIIWRRIIEIGILPGEEKEKVGVDALSIKGRKLISEVASSFHLFFDEYLVFIQEILTLFQKLGTITARAANQ
jgi:hypothetical protein